MKRLFLSSAVFSVILLVFLAMWFLLRKNQPENPLLPQVCFNTRCFSVEIASTSFERELGLMFRNELPIDRGMLFTFKGEGIHSFWMKNTYISLDMIWLNKDKEVVYIEKNALPCEDECSDIIPDKAALYVLEINGGMADQIGLKVGDKMDFYVNQD